MPFYFKIYSIKYIMLILPWGKRKREREIKKERLRSVKRKRSARTEMKNEFAKSAFAFL